MMRLRIPVLVCALSALVTFAASAQQKGQMGVFYANVGWIGQPTAKVQGDMIIAGVESFDDAQAYDLNGIEAWVGKNTGDGDIDCLVMFGYIPESIYTPGNAQQNGSLIEEFIYDGNFVMNTADYIFYVSLGGGSNGENGVKTIMNANFDLWTDGNAIKPTAAGAKYVPSLDGFVSNRSFKLPQIEADANWEAEAIFGEGPAGADPIVLKDADSGGRVGIWMQVSNDALNRGEVALEIFNNWVPTVIELAVEPTGKAATTWGTLKK